MAVKLVTQETLTDCGLACVVMVSGKSLETVRKFAVKELSKEWAEYEHPCKPLKMLAHFDIGRGKKAAAESVEPASNDDQAPGEKKAKLVEMTATKEERQKPKPITAKRVPEPAATAESVVQPPDAGSAQPDVAFESPLRFACCQTGTVVGIRSSGVPEGLIEKVAAMQLESM